jgi:hypothetical protein
VFKRYFKEGLIGSTIIFDSETDEQYQNIDIGMPHNFVDVVSLSELGGSPVIPDAGFYNIYYQDTLDGGFKSISDNGNLDATKTGGSSLPDGDCLGASFAGNPLKIKVVPDGVTVATAYRVEIKQNLT